MPCNQRRLCASPSCTVCHARSFASHPRSTSSHPTKNLPATPRSIFRVKNAKWWFSCDVCHHDFNSTLSDVVTKGSWCPYCACKKLCDQPECVLCTLRSFASHPKSKFSHPTKNLPATPRSTFRATTIKWWFTCDTCHHDFSSALNHIATMGTWCIYCSHKKLCDQPECMLCTPRSFASHPKSKFSHPTKNLPATPRSVFRTTYVKWWFTCETCHHDFNSLLGDIVVRDSWCPYCACNKLCDKPDCTLCASRSFASHPRSEFSHPTKNLPATPRSVFRATTIKWWFTCETCHHDFSSTLNDVVSKDSWCPYCSHNKLCGQPECSQCFSCSFASHPRSVSISKTLNNSDLNLLMISTFSSQKLWFDCAECRHSFQARVSNVTAHQSWCPHCLLKTESKLYDHLNTLYPNMKFERQCRGFGRTALSRLDFLSREERIAIELDGAQHFCQVSNWNDPEDTIAKDVDKMRDCLASNISVIRLLQEDVFRDRNEWVEKLDKLLTTRRTIPVVDYIDRIPELYTRHKSRMNDLVSINNVVPQ